MSFSHERALHNDSTLCKSKKNIFWTYLIYIYLQGCWCRICSRRSNPGRGGTRRVPGCHTRGDHGAHDGHPGARHRDRDPQGALHRSPQSSFTLVSMFTCSQLKLWRVWRSPRRVTITTTPTPTSSPLMGTSNLPTDTRNQVTDTRNLPMDTKNHHMNTKSQDMITISRMLCQRKH